LAADVIEAEVTTSLASLLLMVLLVNHEATELANHVDNVMTIQRANLVTMTKLILLVNPKPLRLQSSFDDFFADVAVVDDGGVMSPASLSLMTQPAHHAANEPANHVTMTPLASHVTTTKAKPPRCLSKSDAILTEDVAGAEVTMSLASRLLMALLANHGVTELANHGTRPRNLAKAKSALVADVMTIQRANRVTMTKLMKPKRLRPLFSFDAVLADVAVVDDVDVTEMPMLLASLLLTTQLGHHVATELASHVTMTQLVSHVTMTKPMQVKPLQCPSNLDGILAEDVAEAEMTMSLVSHLLMALLANHEATELANHGTRPRNLVKARSAPVVDDEMVNRVTMKLMLLVKPRLRNPQLSFDANCVDDVDVTEMLMSPASLSLKEQLANHVVTELVSHVTRTLLVNHVTTPPANHADVARKLMQPKSLKKCNDAHLNAETDEEAGEAVEGNLTHRLWMDTSTSLALKVKSFLEIMTKQVKVLL